MQTPTKKPQPGQATAYQNSRTNYNKKYPPFGKQFNEMRLCGLVPEMRVILTYEWEIGCLFPRIVLDRHIDPVQYHFDYLTGLNLQICTHDNDLLLVDSLIKELEKIRPASIAIFNFDLVGTGTPAFSLLFEAERVEEAA